MYSTIDRAVGGRRYKEWLFAGHDCEIPKPGDWFTLQIGAYPVVVVRGRDGSVRAFHAVCRHLL